MMDTVLQAYEDYDAATHQLAYSPTLRCAANWLAEHLPRRRLTLLARSDEGLMLVAACAVLRDMPTTLERAPFGRTGWAPPVGAILIEPRPPMTGLLSTIKDSWPGLDILVMPPEILTGTPAIAA